MSWIYLIILILILYFVLYTADGIIVSAFKGLITGVLRCLNYVITKLTL